ncbi:hypothetical protein FOBRF1_011637 [Fusarium oxysporum]
MSQSHSGRPSRSNQGPGRPSEIGSALSRELSFVFEDPPSRKETTAKAEPSDKLPERFISLANDLSHEDGQLKRRSEEKLDGPRRVWEKLAELKNIDLTRYPYQRLTLQPWHKLVIIAATVVDRYLGKNALAASTIIKLHGRELAPDTVTRDKRVVLEVIQLTDHLYSHWDHDFALELPLIMMLGVTAALAVGYMAYSYWRRRNQNPDTAIEELERPGMSKLSSQRTSPASATRDVVLLCITVPLEPSLTLPGNFGAVVVLIAEQLNGLHSPLISHSFTRRANRRGADVHERDPSLAMG